MGGVIAVQETESMLNRLIAWREFALAKSGRYVVGILHCAYTSNSCSAKDAVLSARAVALMRR